MAEGLNISHPTRTVLWAPHRCGARYVFDVLRWSIGMTGGGAEGVVTHQFLPPPDGFRVLLLVRNPYPRVLSIWAWLLEIGQLDPDTSFRDFVFRHVERLPLTISRQKRDVGREQDALLRLEHLETDLAAIFPHVKFHFPKNWYRSSRLKGRPWREWYDEETAAAVRQAYGKDFDLGNYPREFE